MAILHMWGIEILYILLQELGFDRRKDGLVSSGVIAVIWHFQENWMRLGHQLPK